MNFELRIALSYLMPTRRSWSRSLLSLLSIFVISAVVWLAIVFLSIAGGLQKVWIKKLVAVDAPIRIRPTDKYFDSYYYNIDALSMASNYQTKSLIEKQSSEITDPHNPEIDDSLPAQLASRDLDSDGKLIDPVKELLKTLQGIPELQVCEWTTGYSNCQIDVHKSKTEREPGDILQKRSFHQMSLIAPFVWRKELIDQLSPISSDDWNRFFDNWFTLMEPAVSAQTAALWRHLKIVEIATQKKGMLLPQSSMPTNGSFQAIADGQTLHFCSTIQELKSLKNRLGETAKWVRGVFSTKGLVVKDEKDRFLNSFFHGKLKVKSVKSSRENLTWRQLPLDVQGLIGTIQFSHCVEVKDVEIQKVVSSNDQSPEEAIAHAILEKSNLNSTNHDFQKDFPFEVAGALVPIQYWQNGARLGDLGTLQCHVGTPGGPEIEQLNVMICGFFDASMMPLGSKLIFTEPIYCRLINEGLPESEQRLHTGYSVFCPLDRATQLSDQIKNSLRKSQIESYWSVSSFEDFAHIRDLLGQLKSDQLLLGVLAVIIIAVACSNIISMLLLLVMEKKREIAILRALGASSHSIALIFALCGFITGTISGVCGLLLAKLTLVNIDSLTGFLSWALGKQLFHPHYYGQNLPNQISGTALFFTLLTTATFSALAALIPALSAGRLQPSKILRDS